MNTRPAVLLFPFLLAACGALRAQEARTAASPFTMTARVLGPDDQPVAGASAEVGGVRWQSTTRYGGTRFYGKKFVADADARIEISSDEPFDAVQVTFTASGLAPAKLFLSRTNENQVVRMDAGATIRGRVVKDGQPLASVDVGVSGAERSSEVFAGRYDATTDANGAFEVQHLPRNTEWWLFGKSASLKEHGAIRPRKVTTGGAGTENDLGDIEVGPGYRVGGVVRTRNGERFPQGLRVAVYLEDIGDSQTADADETGHFSISGIPAGLVTVNLLARDWHLSGLNRSLDELNDFRLIGRVSDHVEGLEILIEPGPYEHRNVFRSTFLPNADQARNRPLHGAEASGPSWILIHGTVVDATTGRAITNATLIPGYQPPITTPPAPAQKPVLKRLVDSIRDTPAPVAWNERPVWLEQRAGALTNSAFTAAFLPLSSQPLLRIEAPGYEPFVSESPAVVTNGLVVRLHRGAGPNGVVLTPTGEPAANASVYYAAGREQFTLDGRTIASVYGQEEFKKQTGIDGSFSFPQRADGRLVFVAHPTGWAEKDVRDGASRLKLRLEPWAAIAGTLVDTNGAPMPGVELHLSRMHDWRLGDPSPNLQHVARTDSQGRFLFVNVPPGRLDIVRYVPMGPNSWSHQPQTWLDADPGKTNEVGNVTYDTPPPAPLTDRIKQKLGL